LESIWEIAGLIRDKAVKGAKTDAEPVHEPTYQAIAIEVGVVKLIGYFVARGCIGTHD
jgi:hypothetical protein